MALRTLLSCSCNLSFDDAHHLPAPDVDPLQPALHPLCYCQVLALQNLLSCNRNLSVALMLPAPCP